MKLLIIILLIAAFIPQRNLCQNASDSLIGFNQPDTINLNDTTEDVPDFLRDLVSQIQEEEVESSEDDVEIEIDGLIMDETRTKAGHDFYDQFFTDFDAPPGASNYSIKIRELPFRMSLTIITIEINDNEIFRSYLQPRQNLIEQTAEQAVYTTTQYLQNYEEIQKQLGSEDQEGTGIY